MPAQAGVEGEAAAGYHRRRCQRSDFRHSGMVR